MTINLYRFDENIDIVDKGSCERGAALAILDNCFEKDLNTFKSVEKAMSETSFGLSKSEQDFIEVSCDGNGLVSVHSDRLYYSSWVSRTFGFKHHFHINGEKDKIKNVIQDFYQMERQAFEGKYSGFLCR